MKKKRQRNQDAETDVLRLVPKNKHSSQGSHTSAEKRKQDQCAFPNTPGIVPGFYLIRKIKEKGDDAHCEDHKKNDRQKTHKRNLSLILLYDKDGCSGIQDRM